MSDVESGEILIADYQGIYVIKMSGDVRLNLCIAFDDCIESLFAREDFQSVFFDLSCAENLDSTTLGLIAKVAIKCQTKLVSNNFASVNIKAKKNPKTLKFNLP